MPNPNGNIGQHPLPRRLRVEYRRWLKRREQARRPKRVIDFDSPEVQAGLEGLGTWTWEKQENGTYVRECNIADVERAVAKIPAKVPEPRRRLPRRWLRVRVRSHRARRPATRRAQGPRSSQDPGSEGDPEPPPAEVAPLAEVIPLPRRRGPTRYTFGLLSPEERGEHAGDPDAALHHFRPDLDGPARLAEFLALPEDLQAAYDHDLEREIEVSRR